MPGLSCSVWDLAPLPGIEPGPPALGVQSVSHWTTREVLRTLTFDFWPPGLSEKQSLLIRAAQFAGGVTAPLICGDSSPVWMLCCQGGGLELDVSLASGSPSSLLFHFEENTLSGRAVSRARCLTPR